MDPQRPSTWQKYRNGLCEGCWAGCCTLPLEVSAYDLIRLGLTSEEEAGESLKRLATRLKKSKMVRSFNPSTGIFIMEQKYGRDCIFLDERRRCSVYEMRPEVCRKFPKIGPRPGFCPAEKIKKRAAS